jgi:acyl-CoA synthetase (NDP forming)
VSVPSVAVIGASKERHKYGNRAVRAYLRQGWTVYPVNPTETEVEGLPTFARIADTPAAVDRATLYVPPEIGRTLLAGIKDKGVGELFVNPGAESDELVAEAERLGLDPIFACSIVDIGERP